MDNKDPKNVWNRFKRNKVAYISMWLIVILFVVSLFAYLIVPDNTPNANHQNNTIALKAPGFETQVLIVKKNREVPQVSFFKKLLQGQESMFLEVPFTDITYLKNEVKIINHFNRPEFYKYEDILYALDISKEIVKEDGSITFFTIDGKKNLQDLSNLTAKSKNNIELKTYWLGTDKFGRDIFSRIILGARISIFVGLIAVFISLFVGVTLGAIAGFYGGWIDQLIMLILNVNWSIPTLLMVFAIVLSFDRGISVIFLAIGLTMWVEVARVVRGQVKILKSEQYIMAANNLGYSSFRIIFKHIIPNIIGPIMVLAAANFSTAVLVEAGLSYLGFGVEPPTPSIGNILNEHYGYAITGKVFLAIVPALTIIFLVLSFNLVGSGLRDAFDVKRQQS